MSEAMSQTKQAGTLEGYICWTQNSHGTTLFLKYWTELKLVSLSG